MTLLAANLQNTVVVKASEAETLGWGGREIKLLVDSSGAGGLLSAVRIKLEKGIEGAKPHTHHGEAELFYVVDGELEVLAGERVVSASKGDLVMVPPNQAHAFGTSRNRGAELLIVITPGIERFDYFRLGAKLARGEITRDELLATQDLYDNHFLESPTWQAARAAIDGPSK